MRAIRTFILTNAWLVAVVILIAVGLYQFVEPAPPREITMATGDPDGYYHVLGTVLKEGLRKEGVELNLISTAGSNENMEFLTDPDGAVSIAFVQSGMEHVFDAGETSLASLGALYYEPLWLFYRGTRPVNRLPALIGKRLAIGGQGSGTHTVARSLLEDNSIDTRAPAALACCAAMRVASAAIRESAGVMPLRWSHCAPFRMACQSY